MKTLCVCVLGFAFGLLSLSGCNQTSKDDRFITTSDNVLAIFTNSYGTGLDSEDYLRFVIVIWGDGTVIWSSDFVEGGGPYRLARIDPGKVTEVFTRLSHRGSFENPQLMDRRWGPDSAYSVILFRTDGKELQMESWHELEEDVGAGIARHNGASPLNEKKLWTELQDEPASYLHFRMCWLELKLAAFSLLPSAGELVNAEFVEENGKVMCRFQSK